MPRVYKNLTLPVVVRKRNSPETNLIGLHKLEDFELLATKGKEYQFLFYYNFLNGKRIQTLDGRNGKYRKPVYFKTENRAPQTTLVIDFDKVQPEHQQAIDAAFTEFNDFLQGKAILTKSPSGGRHVMYVIQGKANEFIYKRLQKAVIEGWFSEFAGYVDEPVSMSLNGGLFHSQHISTWIAQDKINVTPKAQGNSRRFWNTNLELSFEEVSLIIDQGHKLSERTSTELDYDLFKTLDVINHTGAQRNGTDQNKARQEEECTAKTARLEFCATRICRILVELQLRSTTSQNDFQVLIARAQAKQSETTSQYLASDACQTVCGAEGLQQILDYMVKGYTSEGSVNSTEEHGHNQKPDGQVGVQGDSSPVDGCGISSDVGNVGDARERLYSHCQPGALLGVIQDIRAHCVGGGLKLEKLGELLSAHSLRSHSHWSINTKESDINVFYELMRQALATDARIPRAFRSSPQGIFEWLRHTGRYLANERTIERSLLQFAQDAARCWRLFTKTQGIKIKGLTNEQTEQLCDAAELDAMFKPEPVDDFLKFVFAQNIETLGQGISKDNLQSVKRMFREELPQLRVGVLNLFKHIAGKRAFAIKGDAIAIGLEDFQLFFNTHVRKAGALRIILMNALSTKTEEYVPCVKRRAFYINLEVLDVYCVVLNSGAGLHNTPATVQELVPLLTTGQTWTTIRRYCKPMLAQLGLSKSLEVWYDALDTAEVNCLGTRKRDVKQFLAVLAEQHLQEAI